MDEPNRRCFWIDKVDRAAIGNMNTERDLFLIRDDPIATGEFFVARDRLIDDRDFISVDLLGGEQRPIRHSNFSTRLAMNSIKPLQRFGFVMGNIDARDSLNQRVTAKRDCLKCRKIFDRDPRDHQKNPRSFYFELGLGEIAVTGPG
jgi:hypothetical protein